METSESPDDDAMAGPSGTFEEGGMTESLLYIDQDQDLHAYSGRMDDDVKHFQETEADDGGEHASNGGGDEPEDTLRQEFTLSNSAMGLAGEQIQADKEDVVDFGDFRLEEDVNSNGPSGGRGKRPHPDLEDEDEAEADEPSSMSSKRHCAGHDVVRQPSLAEEVAVSQDVLVSVVSQDVVVSENVEDKGGIPDEDKGGILDEIHRATSPNVNAPPQSNFFLGCADMPVSDNCAAPSMVEAAPDVSAPSLPYAEEAQVMEDNRGEREPQEQSIVTHEGIGAKGESSTELHDMRQEEEESRGQEGGKGEEERREEEEMTGKGENMVEEGRDLGEGRREEEGLMEEETRDEGREGEGGTEDEGSREEVGKREQEERREEGSMELQKVQEAHHVHDSHSMDAVCDDIHDMRDDEEAACTTSVSHIESNEHGQQGGIDNEGERHANDMMVDKGTCEESGQSEAAQRDTRIDMQGGEDVDGMVKDEEAHDKDQGAHSMVKDAETHGMRAMDDVPAIDKMCAMPDMHTIDGMHAIDEVHTIDGVSATDEVHTIDGVSATDEVHAVDDIQVRQRDEGGNESLDESLDVHAKAQDSSEGLMTDTRQGDEHSEDKEVEQVDDRMAHEGSMKDCSVQDSSVKDGNMQDLSVKDGNMQDLSVKDGNMQDCSVKDGSVQYCSVSHMEETKDDEGATAVRKHDEGDQVSGRQEQVNEMCDARGVQAMGEEHTAEHVKERDNDDDDDDDDDMHAHAGMSKQAILRRIRKIDDELLMTHRDIAVSQSASPSTSCANPLPGSTPCFKPAARGASCVKAIYERNAVAISQVHKDMCTLLWVRPDYDFAASPLYTRVQDAPCYQEERLNKGMELALEYRYLDMERREGGKRRGKERQSGDDDDMPKRKTRSSGDIVRTSAEFDAIMSDFERQQHCTEGAAVIPDMLVIDSDKRQKIFYNNNGLIEDPVGEEHTRRRSNLWSEEEKQLFIEKLADFAVRPEKEGLRKNFYKISHYFPNKSTRDCVEYYYLAKKAKGFKDKYKKLELKHRRTYHLRRKMNVLTGKVSGAAQSVSIDLESLHTTRKHNDEAEQVLVLSSLGYECMDDYQGRMSPSADAPIDATPQVKHSRDQQGGPSTQSPFSGAAPSPRGLAGSPFAVQMFKSMMGAGVGSARGSRGALSKDLSGSGWGEDSAVDAAEVREQEGADREGRAASAAGDVEMSEAMEAMEGSQDAALDVAD